MAALAGVQRANVNTGDVGRGGVVAADIIYQGAMVGRNAAGYLVPFAGGAGATFFAGHALETVDNSAGSAGDKLCDYRRGVYYMTVPAFDSVAIANVGDPVYGVTDNHADLALSDPGGGAADIVGYVHDILPSGEAVVKFVARNN